MYAYSKQIPKSLSKVLPEEVTKCVSVARVKSYGSITTVACSAGYGSNGGILVNELGYAWGMFIGSYPDVQETTSNNYISEQNLNEHFGFPDPEPPIFKVRQ